MKQEKYDYERIAQAIGFISEHVKEQPSLEDIAREVHISPFHFQKMFTDWAGVSPKKFLQFLTVEYAKQILNGEKHPSLFETAQATGLSGSGRLHDLFIKLEGMTPGEYKNGGEHLMISYSLRESQFGNYLVASTGKGISNLFFFDEHEHEVVRELHELWPKASIKKETDDDQEKIARFFNNDFSNTEKIKLHLKGTEFQLKVWEALLKIPQGNLSTYGAIANALDRPGASRAVGTAIGSNPIGFIIPCHRVIRNAGVIGEFRWGTTRKKAMIGWEAGKRNPDEETKR